MHRLFAAIRPPDSIRDRLLDIMDGVKRARWQDDDQLHLTLRFIGEVEREVARDIAAALGRVRQEPFEIALEGVGTFDSGGRRGSLWVGVRPHDKLKALHKRVDGALRTVGVAPDRRAFLPHITIARLNRRSGEIGEFLATHGGIASDPFRVEDFCLYESFLGREGASYEIVERYRLEPERG